MIKGIGAFQTRLGETDLEMIEIQVRDQIFKFGFSNRLKHTLIGVQGMEMFTDDCKTWRILGFQAFSGIFRIETPMGLFNISGYCLPEIDDLALIGLSAVQFRQAHIGSYGLGNASGARRLISQNRAP